MAWVRAGVCSADVAGLKKLILHNPVTVNVREGDRLAGHSQAGGDGAQGGHSSLLPSTITHYSLECKEQDKLLHLLCLLRFQLVHRKVSHTSQVARHKSQSQIASHKSPGPICYCPHTLSRCSCTVLGGSMGPAYRIHLPLGTLALPCSHYSCSHGLVLFVSAVVTNCCHHHLVLFL